MGILMKMIMSSAAITVAATVGYNIIKYSLKRSLRSNEQTSVKKGRRRNIDKIYPTLHNLRWKKIGKVIELLIYTVKSSKHALVYDSCEFRDYGMCISEYGTYFWDGMFTVYNKTKGKFEDNQRYPKLQSMIAVPSGTAKVYIYESTSNAVQSDIAQDRSPFNRFKKETWNATVEAYYSSNEEVNTWVKNAIEANQINGAVEDVILAHMLPRSWDSTQKIRKKWDRFVHAYNTMEEDETGKFITLPRFVLITMKTYEELSINHENNPLTPNIIVETDESINSFAEKNWDCIRIGNDVILRNVKPVPSNDERFEHYGIYCGLWSGGNVKLNDEVFIH